MESAPRLYPITVSAFRLPNRSLSQPENSLEIEAVASPTPSMIPTVNVLAPSTVTKNTGRSAWTISEEMSANKLTNPSAQMLPGKRARAVIVVASSALLIVSLRRGSIDG